MRIDVFMEWSPEPQSIPNHFDLLFQHPFEQFDLPAWVHAEIANEILLRLALPVAVPARVDDEDVALLHLYGCLSDHLRRDHGPIIHMR
jgi:hypothetical protein